jgi:hypothetical protein
MANQASHFQPMIDPYEAGKRIREQEDSHPSTHIDAPIEAGVEGQVILDALVDAGLLERWLELLDPKGEWVAWYRTPIERTDDE